MHPCNRHDESLVMISITFSNYDYLFSHDNNNSENFVTATVPFCYFIQKESVTIFNTQLIR